MAWEPIATAPKNGTVVDLWCAGEPSDIEFYTGVYARSGRLPRCMFIDGKWRPAMGLTKGLSLVVEPTHWLPQPDAPA